MFINSYFTFHLLVLYSAVYGQGFKEPGTRLGPTQLERLKSTKTQEPIIEEARQQLMSQVEQDMSGPPKAVPTILVAFNPTDSDLKKFPAATQRKLLERRKEVKTKTEQGLVGGHKNWNFDGERVYRISVANIMSPKKEFVNKMLEILAAWPDELKEFGSKSENGPLEAAWGTASFVRALHSLRNQDQLPKQLETRWNALIDKFLIPNLRHHDIKTKDGKNKLVTLMNWSTSILDALLSIGMFRNDAKLVKEVEQKTREFFNEYFPTNTGQATETLRDIVHAQFGLGGLINICEVFHHQGVDLYGIKNNIIAKSLEYHAGIILKEKIPDDMKGKAINWNKFVDGSWDIGLNHFMNRLNLTMPLSSKLMQQERPAIYTFHWGLGTLTHFHSDGPNPVISQGLKRRSLQNLYKRQVTNDAGTTGGSRRAKIQQAPSDGIVQTDEGVERNLYLGDLDIEVAKNPPPAVPITDGSGTSNSTSTSGVIGEIKLGSNGTDAANVTDSTSEATDIVQVKLANV